MRLCDDLMPLRSHLCVLKNYFAGIIYKLALKTQLMRIRYIPPRASCKTLLERKASSSDMAVRKGPARAPSLFTDACVITPGPTGTYQKSNLHFVLERFLGL